MRPSFLVLVDSRAKFAVLGLDFQPKTQDGQNDPKRMTPRDSTRAAKDKYRSEKPKKRPVMTG